MKRGRIIQVDPAGPTVDFQFNPETAERTGRGQIWADHDRPMRDSVVEWKGRTPFQWRFTLRLDNLATEEPVDPILGQLRRWYFGDGKKRPPLLRFEYGGASLEPCVLRELTLDPESEIRNANLATIFCDVEVILFEYIEPAVVVDPVAKRQVAAASTAGNLKSVRMVTVVAGDTLWGIAQRELGAGARYREIAELNNIPDPDLIFPGQKFRLPAR